MLSRQKDQLEESAEGYAFVRFYFNRCLHHLHLPAGGLMRNLKVKVSAKGAPFKTCGFLEGLVDTFVFERDIRCVPSLDGDHVQLSLLIPSADGYTQLKICYVEIY